jgi:GNAT superfamily N-acetyltransferase
MSPLPQHDSIQYSDDPARVDLNQLLELYQATWWANARNRDQVLRALQHSRPILTAWEGDRMVGFTRVISDLTYRATIWDVIVRPSHQGRDIGKHLIQNVLEHPDLQSVTTFLLLTKDKHAFYERLGFLSERDTAMTLRR